MDRAIIGSQPDVRAAPAQLAIEFSAGTHRLELSILKRQAGRPNRTGGCLRGNASRDTRRERYGNIAVRSFEDDLRTGGQILYPDENSPVVYAYFCVAGYTGRLNIPTSVRDPQGTIGA
jgi:hypothetical protein